MSHARFVASCFALLLMVACGDEPPSAPAAPSNESDTASDPAPASEPEPSAPEAPPEPEPEPALPPPTPAQIDAAGERCGQGYMAVLRGAYDEGGRDIEAALAVLRRVEARADRAALGACLYNAARLAEEQLDIVAARRRYDESLEARPNAIAQRRRRRLGQRDPEAPAERSEMLQNQLRRAVTFQCRREDCAIESKAMAHSGGGRLLRAGVVAAGTEDEMFGVDAAYDLFLGFSGPRGEFQWGPRLWPERQGGYVRWDEPRIEMAFRPAIPDRPWLLFVRMHGAWTEECTACAEGSVSDGDTRDLAICELSEETARCYVVHELRSCQGDTADPTEYRPCHMDVRRYVTFDSEGLEVHGSDPATNVISPEDVLSVGAFPWSRLFPEPAPESEAAAAPDESHASE